MNMRSGVVWHLLTGEFPPAPGGVADYSRLVAAELARRGEMVHVWTPGKAAASDDHEDFQVHRLPDRFGTRSLRTLTEAIGREGGEPRLLVQYVPHAFGMRALNMLFCLWLSRQPYALWIMFHEVAYPFESGQPLKHRILAHGNRIMAVTAARSAERIFVSVPSWGTLLSSLSRQLPWAEWLPVPANVTPVASVDAAERRREELGIARGRIIGYFGTYRGSDASSLLTVMQLLLSRSLDVHFLLMGRGSRAVAESWRSRLVPHTDRVHAVGELPPAELSSYLVVSDVMLLPYADGVSGRRGSAMAALAHGVPVVTTLGAATEAIWSRKGAVMLFDVGDHGSAAASVELLLGDREKALTIGARGKALYAECFDIRHTVEKLMGR